MTPTLDPTATASDDRLTVEVHVPADSAAHEREILRRALAESPPRVPSRYFYDDHGSRLFEQITELPEYYQTRTERALLEQHADDIVAASSAEELLEVGSGASTKTRVLLDAMERAGSLRLYVPLDVSEGIVRRAAAELLEEYPELRVHAVIGNFLRDLEHVPPGHNRLSVFLGGTIGNLAFDGQAADFLCDLGKTMSAGDFLLLGTDLIKDPERLEVAYNDAAGVTAEFNLNALSVLNERFLGDFSPVDFRHRAIYREDLHRIEMHLVAQRPVRATLAALDTVVELDTGGFLLTEISTKFDRAKATDLFRRGGFELRRWYTDPREDFALSLAAWREC